MRMRMKKKNDIEMMDYIKKKSHKYLSPSEYLSHKYYVMASIK